MDILRCMWTRRMGAPSTFLRGAVRLCVLHAVVASLGYAAMRTIDDSNWAKDIAASRAYQLPELDVVVDTEGLHVTRAVLPTESDILIIPEYADDKLAGYGRVLDYAHPGNVMWNDLTRSYGRGYVQLSVELQQHFCRSLLAFVQQSSRFLKQGIEREFLPIEDDGELYYLCHRDLVAATDKKVFAMLRQLDSLRTVAKLGRFANTAMQATHSPQYLAYWEKILTPLRRWKPRMELSNDVSRTVVTPRLMIRTPPKSEFATTWKIGSSIPKSGAPKEPFPLAWIREGDVVEAMYRCSSNFYYRGTVTAVVACEGTFDIEFDDGDFNEGLGRRCLRPFHPYQVGEDIQIRQAAEDGEDDEWLNGVILSIAQNEGGYRLFEIQVKDGEVLAEVVSGDIRREVVRPLKKGDRVSARYDDGDEWFPGKIRAVNADGTYYIHYMDGDIERSVPYERIRK